MLTRLESPRVLKSLFDAHPVLYLPERAALWFGASVCEAWLTDASEFVLLGRGGNGGTVVTTNLDSPGAMQAMLSNVPCDDETLFVFLREPVGLLERFRFDLNSMEVFQSLAPHGEPRVVRVPARFDLTEIRSAPGLEEDLEAPLPAGRHVWPEELEPQRRHMVLHRRAVLEAYLCVRSWFDGFWDVEELLAGHGADRDGLRALLLAAWHVVRAVRGVPLISRVADRETVLLRVARRMGWRTFRTELHIRRGRLA
jgi:hypothetical protein